MNIVPKPWQHGWECLSASTSKPFALIPDLCIHLVFDLSGKIDDEPFLLNPNPERVTLTLPPECHLVGLAWPLWTARNTPIGLKSENQIHTVGIDLDWAFFLYFELLEIQNSAPHKPLNIATTLSAFANHVTSLYMGETGSPGLLHADQFPGLRNYSERHRRRICVELVGLSPKKVQRIARFQRLIKQIESGHEPNYEEYYDQAHAIREFKRMAGVTPSQYMKETKKTA